MPRPAADAAADRIAWILFGLLLALCATLGAALLIEEQPFADVVKDGEVVRVYHGHGVAHPEVRGMLHGGSGRKRQERIFGLSWLLGVLQLAWITGCLFFAVGTGRRGRPVHHWLLAAGLAGIAVMTLLFWSYSVALEERSLSLFAGLPAASAWLIFGLWFFPFLFCGVYFVYFHRVVFTEDAAAKFQRLLQSKSNAPAARPGAGE